MILGHCLAHLQYFPQQNHIILHSMTYYVPELGIIFLIAILCTLKIWYFVQEIRTHPLINSVSTVTTSYLERRIIISLYLHI